MRHTNTHIASSKQQANLYTVYQSIMSRKVATRVCKSPAVIVNKTSRKGKGNGPEPEPQMVKVEEPVTILQKFYTLPNRGKDKGQGQTGARTNRGKAVRGAQKPTLNKVLRLLNKGRVDKATVLVEAMIKLNESKKKREPTEYNQFIKEHMADLKDNKPWLSTQEKIRQIAAMWREKEKEKEKV